MNRFAQLFFLMRELGPGWLGFRVRYAWRRRSGALSRRTPIRPWPSGGAVGTRTRRWFEPHDDVGGGAESEAAAIGVGQFRLFGYHDVAVGMLPAWASNPLTGQSAPSNRHWSQLGDFAFGDIKGIWELSRFPWAFALGRAYARTRDERHVARFWALVEHWLEHNPPNGGPNWMCGQEATFRLMAVLWAADVMRDAVATTPERLARLAGLVAVTGDRIAANLDYALSQSNNHGVSECVGLVTAALWCETAPSAASWQRRGLEALRGQLDDLVYADGGFSQHSAVYHRVLLHDLLWLVVVLRRSGIPVPSWLESAGKRALGFIAALMDPETGRVPLYGPNDGANILLLADADHLDFRPVVQSGAAVLHGVLPLGPGPWDEAARWLAPEVRRRGSLPKLPSQSGYPVGLRHFSDAGLVRWTQGGSEVIFRCPTRFRHRPAQADLLHVGLSWRGIPLVIDAGTYSYNTTGPFAGGLKEAAVHNTVTFDGGEPLRKVSRFLYLPWPRGAAAWRAEAATFAASHSGWSSLALQHERRLRAARDGGGAHWEVRDVISGRGVHRGRLHWLLADLPYAFRPEQNELVLQTPQGPFAVRWAGASARASLVRADANSNRGWWSPYYGHAAPALSLAIEFEFDSSVEFATRFGPLSTV